MASITAKYFSITTAIVLALGLAPALAQNGNINILASSSVLSSSAPLTNYNGTIWGTNNYTGGVFAYTIGNSNIPVYSGTTSGQYNGLVVDGSSLYMDAGGGMYSIDTQTGVATDYADGLASGARGNMTPVGSLLYGATTGGFNNYGGIFSYNINNSSWAKQLIGFSNTNGAMPESALNDINGIFYGTTLEGGLYGDGTIFSFNPQTNTINSLFSFNTTDGKLPYNIAGMTYNNGILYGTTSGGGSGGGGTLFAFNVANDTLTTLENFVYSGTGLVMNSSPIYAGGILYGTTNYGGAYNDGMIYSYNVNNNSFSDVADFSGNTAHPDNGVLDINQVLYGEANGNIYDVSGYQAPQFYADTTLSITTPSDASNVPEPSSALSMMFGALALFLLRLRRLAA